MPNNVLLDALNETLQQCHCRRMECENKVERIQEEVNRRLGLKEEAEQKNERAVFADEELVTKMDILRTHVNGLADKPAALVRQLNDLQAQQGKTYAAREYAADNVRNCQEAVKKAEETLRFEKQRHRQAEVEYQQVADEICRVQNAA